MRVLTQGGLPDYDFEGAFRFESSDSSTSFEDLRVEPMQEGWFRMEGIVFNRRACSSCGARSQATR